MTACVVDASVVTAAFFQEEHSNAARALVTSDRQLHAPDLILPEVANVIWKRCRRKEIDASEATELLSDVLALPLLLTSSVDLTESALEIAVASN
jgi:predicted nucleic acid-binding protein